MANWRTLEWGVIGVILLTAISASAAVGHADSPGRNPPALGEGNVTVTVDSLPVEKLQFDGGRFGADITYLRIPDVRVNLADVHGTPRLVYRVEVPALEVDESTTRVISSRDRGPTTIRGVDHALDPASVTRDSYVATISVRWQAFGPEGSRDVTVVRRNETLEVENG